MNPINPIHAVRKAWRIRILLKIGLWILVIVAFLIGYSWFVSNSTVMILGGILLLVTLVWLEVSRMPRTTEVVKLINEQFPQSEYSTDLLLTGAQDGLIGLQQERVSDRFRASLPQIIYPVKWLDSLKVIIGLALVILIGRLVSASDEVPLISDQHPVIAAEDVIDIGPDSISIEIQVVDIKPPVYTILKSRSQSNFNLEVQEGSNVTWTLRFSSTVDRVWLQFGNEIYEFEQKGKNWKISQEPLRGGLYTLNFESDQNKFSSEYFQLQLIEDEPPSISFEGIPQFHRLDFEPGMVLDFEVKAADDFGLTEGHLVATITKGSGESVKFREQKMPFDKEIQGKEFSTNVRFRLDDFGMEPGNELYFYSVITDNKEPRNQISRTETYFLILEDTTQYEFSLQGSLGVDLMPDFFRSQLQIIMDTEKLIKEKKTLAKQKFNAMSNELGYDQKQLRLKYGQFIGEEEDSGLEIEEEQPPTQNVEATGDNVLQEFGHDHDHENEEGQFMDRGADHHHEEDLTDPEAEKDPLDEFMHNHEDEETATFYTETLKSKLRAALTQMWDAELYLRLFEPHKSLPYQYEAHRLLKEIRNHARIYVQRIGFDPPTVNEDEARLTGKLKELNDHPFVLSQDRERTFESLKKAIGRINQLREHSSLSAKDRDILTQAGNELAGLAVDQPGNYLMALNQLRKVLDVELLTAEDLAKLRFISATMQGVINDSPNTSAGFYSSDELNQKFIQELLKSEKP